MTNTLGIPTLGFGLGLRAKHYPYIYEHSPEVDWFEIISENFMDTDGRPKRHLERIKERYPVVMHGVSLSIGTIDPLNSEYLSKLKALADWLQPAWVSDHLCWTGNAHRNTHDLLPVPYTEEALSHVISRIHQVQEILGRPLIIENPSTYFEYSDSTMSEAEFITHMAQGTGCGLLLDVNNVYVSCYNHRLDPKTYLDALPLERVVQIHLAGHTNKGTHIVDTHDGHVIEEVWALYRYVISKAGIINTMIEWDDKIPDFPVLYAELDKAKEVAKTASLPSVLPNFDANLPPHRGNAPANYAQHHERVQSAIHLGAKFDSPPESWIRPKPNFPASEQIGVYIKGYRYRLFDIITEEYPVLRKYMGDVATNAFIRDYINSVPSEWWNASRVVTRIPEFASIHQSCDAFARELCRMETSISLLFHATETKALAPEHMQNVTPDESMDMRINPRIALQLFEFDHNINEYYQSVMDKISPPAIRNEKSYLVVFRHEDIMWRLELERAEHHFMMQLFCDNTVAEALEVLLEAQAVEESMLAETIQRWFARWVRNGLLAAPAENIALSAA